MNPWGVGNYRKINLSLDVVPLKCSIGTCLWKPTQFGNILWSELDAVFLNKKALRIHPAGSVVDIEKSTGDCRCMDVPLPIYFFLKATSATAMTDRFPLFISH